jgi:hypothetical protein
MLVQWLKDGLIQPIEFRKRVVKLGYNDADANLLLIDALKMVNERTAKQAELQAKADIAAAEKRQRAADRAAAKAQRTANEALRYTRQLGEMRARRERQQLSAGAKLAKVCNCDIYDAVATIKSEKQRIIREYGITLDEALEVLIRASEAWFDGTINGYIANVSALAQLVVGEQGELSVAASSVNGNTNGSIHPSGETVPLG